MRIIKFQRGRILVEDPGEKPILVSAFEYRRIIEESKSNGLEIRDEVLQAKSTQLLKSDFTARAYQTESVEAWVKNGGRGIIVLPTGAGKTIVAIKAMESVQASTLIVVPTIVLLEQWRKTLEGAFKIPIGGLGGGYDEIRPITVATYDSAALRATKLGNLFHLIIFDEVHHLPTPRNSGIGLNYIAPMRLGLTATLGEEPEILESLLQLVGPVIYKKKVDDLAGIHLSDYTIRTIPVALTPQEKLEYDRMYQAYRGFLQRSGIKIRSAADYMNFVRRSGVDPEARRALLARNAAMDIALNSSGKINYLKNILQSNPEVKTIIFTRHNKLVYKISKLLLIPAITHQTVSEERRSILDNFRSGPYKRIITSQVLDEGIDVPDAALAVILSGTGSSRQFIQRLGRILRKREGKQAVLIELVSMETAETRISQEETRIILPPELLKVRRTKTAIHPLFMTADNQSLAKTLISIYKNEIDHKRWELNEGLQSCEELGYDYRLVRGLSFILDSHCIFSSRSVIPPEKLRPKLFAEAAKTPVFSEADRIIVLERVAKAMGVEPFEVDESMYADLLEEQALTDFEEPEPADLLGYYNHALAAAVLAHSVRIEMEYLGKSEVVEKAAETLGDFECRGTTSSRITINLKPLKQVSARGAKMERLLTALILTRGWIINADVLYPVRLNETRPLALSLKLHGHLLKAKPIEEEIIVEIPDKPQKRSSYGDVIVLEDTANKLGITDRALLKLIEAEGTRFVKLSGVVYSPKKLETIKAELMDISDGDLKEFKALLKGHGVKNVVAVLESLGYVVEPGVGKELHVYRLKRKPSSI